MLKTLVTIQLPEKVLEELKDVSEIVYNDSMDSMKKEEIISKVEGVDAILCPLSDKIDSDILEAGKKLKIVANFGAGFDNIDVKRAAELGITVSNAPAPHSSVSTAELSIALILSALRRIPEGDKLARSGGFHGWKPNFFLGREMNGKTLGVFGTGSIGKKLIELTHAFGVNIIYNNRHQLDAEYEKAYDLKFVEFDELLSNSDILTLHTSFTPELKHKINDDAFNSMKTGAVIVNASRGPVVDESALIRALKSGKISAAALDVYEFEPSISEELISMPNVILTPHIGNATYEAREEMGLIAVKNIAAVFSGKAAPNRVNF